MSAVGVASLAAGVAVFAWVRTSGGDLEMIADGKQLYMEHCASCHGRNLEGQPDWRRQLPSGRMPAPPHDVSGHTWHHGDRTLARITKEGAGAVVGGAYESDMPGFGEVLSDTEIMTILGYIRSHWPEREQRHQARMSRREDE